MPDRDIPIEAEKEKLNVLDYVIVTVQTISGSTKCFVGQIREIYTDSDSFKINFLKKINSKFADDKFVFPEKVDTSYVKREEILKVLIPISNRRHQLIFKEIKASKLTVS